MRFRYIIATALFLPLFSCSHLENEPQDHSDEIKLVEVNFTIAASETKASMGNALTPQWEEGDAFSVYDPTEKAGRKFTAISVEDGVAHIQGMISEGEYPLSIVYPYEIVKTWTSQNDCQIEYPMSQVIPDGADVDPKALACASFSTSFSDVVRMTALCPLVRFSVSRDDVDEVTISLAAEKGSSAEMYSIFPETDAFEKGEYYALVKPGKYSGGVGMTCETVFDVEYGKKSSNVLELAAGDCISLGCATDGEKRVKYECYGEVEIADFDTFVTEAGLYDSMGTASKIAVEGILNLYFWRYKNDVMYTTNISYTSADIKGNPVTLSARVYIPKVAVTGSRKLDGVVMSSRHTLTKAALSPTNNPYNAECALAWKNCALIMCDLHGFGTDIDSPQAFVNGDLCARGAIDGLEATLQLLDDLGVRYEDKIYNFGYSQGGLIAAACQKFVYLHPERGLKLYKSFAGGGAYDFELCFDNYVSEAWDATTRFVILSIISINESEELGLDYTRIFKEPLLSNYQEWVLDKKYTIGGIMERVGTNVLSEVVVPEFLAKTSSEYQAIIAKSASYNLVNGWGVPSGSHLYLFHSTEDNYIPYANFTELKTALGSASNIHYKSGGYGSHDDAIINFVTWVLNNWD